MHCTNKILFPKKLGNVHVTMSDHYQMKHITDNAVTITCILKKKYDVLLR